MLYLCISAEIEAAYDLSVMSETWLEHGPDLKRHGKMFDPLRGTKSHMIGRNVFGPLRGSEETR